MKTLCNPFFILFFSFLFCGLRISAQPTELTEVNKAADAGISHFLDLIPVGEESHYGFKNRNEFTLVEFGTQYKVITLNKSFYTETFEKNKSYFQDANEWIIPIKVKDEYRALLTISKMDGIWKAVNFGSTGLANEFANFELLHPQLDGYGTMLSVHNPLCDFMLYYSKRISPDFIFFPLASAQMALEMTEKTLDIYSLEKLYDLIIKHPSKY